MEEANLQGPSDALLPSTSHQQWADDQDEAPQSSSSRHRASEIGSRFVEAIVDPKSRVDTAAPIDSVKGAVTKFGGILDWKEKRKQDQQDDDVEKVQEEAAECQERWNAAQAGRAQAVRELGNATREADKLRLSLKRSQIEEAQARHESEVAQRSFRELQGGASETKAVAELQAVRAEVESLEKVCAAAVAEAGGAAARARKAAAEARESGKAVEGLAAEVVALHADLESSRAAHVDGEERRLRLALALEQDKSQWQMELEDAQQEAKRLRAQLMAACDVEMKAEAASQVMASLLVLTADPVSSSEAACRLAKVRKEVEDVKARVDTARDEAECLRVAAASMRDELGREKAALAALRRREGLSSASIPYLRAELAALTAKAAAMEAEETRMAQQRVAEAAIEAEEAKAKARSAREEVTKAREEASVAKAAAAAVEARLEAVAREILAATASEEIATASAGVLLQQPRQAESITLAAAEYGELSRRVRETEEAADRRVMEAVRLIKDAKDAEVRVLERLAQQDRRTVQRRQAFEAATLEAEEAEFARLTAERDLRQWRADHDHHSPRAGLAEISVLHDRRAAADNPHILSPRGGYMQPRTAAELTTPADAEARQRKTNNLFPRIVMFLARKRAQSWK